MSDVLKLGKKLLSIGVTFTTVLWSLGFAAFVPAAVANAASCPALASGDLLKVKGMAAIYAIDSNGKTLYFPSGDEFKSWNVNDKYGGYVTVDQACYDSLPVPSAAPLGVNFRPGSYVIKRPSSTQLYVVEPNNMKAKITTEAARALYGANYKVMTVADVFWTNYGNTLGADITEAKVHPGMLVSNGGKNWYVDADGKLREVTAAGFTANRFKTTFIRPVTDAMIAGMTTGTVIDSVVAAISDRTQTGGSSNTLPSNNNSAGVVVALAADTPASMGVPQDATGVVFTKFTVKATMGDATVSDVILHRIGLGAANDLASVYLYDGATRLTSGRTVSSDTNTVTFSNVKLNLSAGTMKTLSVVADLDTTLATTGDADGFEVVNVNGVAVTGVTGNIMTVGAASVSSVTVNYSGSTGSAALGASSVEVARGTIDAGSATYDVKVTSLTLTNSGSLANTNLANLKLTLGSQDVATASAMTGDKVVFNLPAPYVITKGDTKTFYVYADITGGRVDDTIKFYVDQKSDVQVMDTQYNAGANLTNSFSSGNQTYTLTGGDLTLANNGPASATIGKNVNNVTLQKLSFSASNAITVKKTRIYVYILDANGVGTTTAAIYDYIKNVKLVDLDKNNSTIVGPQSNFGTGTTASGLSYYKEFTDTFDVNAGQTRHLAVLADIDTNMTNSFKVYTKVDFGQTNAVQYQNNSQYVAAANIVPNTLTGNQMTISGASLQVTRATPPASATVVKGATVPALGILLTPSASDAVKVTGIRIRVYASSSAFASTLATYSGDTAGNAIVNTISLWEEGANAPIATKNVSNLSGTIGTTSGGYYYADFTGLNYVVPAGTPKKLIAQVVLKDTLPASPTYVVLAMHGTSDIDTETAADGKSVSESTNSIINTTAGTTTQTQLTVNSGGTVTVAVDGNSPTTDIVVSGSGPVTFTTYKLKATQESFTVTGLALTASTTNDISSIFISYKNKAGATVTKTGVLNGSAVTFNDGTVDMYLPVDQYAYLTVGANLNTIVNGSTSGNALKVGLTKAASQWTSGSTLTDGFILLGEGSQNKKYGATDNITVDNSNAAAQYIYKTKVTVAESDPGSVVHSTRAQDAVGVFTFTSQSEPGSNQNSVLNSITVQLSGNLIASAAAGNGSVTLSAYNGSTFDSAHLMGSATITGVDSGASTAVAISLTAQNEFSGTKQVFVVADTTDTDFTDSAANTEKLTTQINTWMWNDGSVNTATPVSGTPVYGKTYTY